MKSRTILYTVALAAMAVFAFSPSRLSAQADVDTAAGAELLQTIKTQQATMAENQKQIDEKMADIAEALRVARIFVARGGK